MGDCSRVCTILVFNYLLLIVYNTLTTRSYYGLVRHIILFIFVQRISSAMNIFYLLRESNFYLLNSIFFAETVDVFHKALEWKVCRPLP